MVVKVCIVCVVELVVKNVCINESVKNLKDYAEEAVAESFERWMMRRSTCWSCEERCLIPSRIQAFSHDVHCCNGYTRVVLDRGFR